MRRQTLAFTLWPDEPKSAARANLRRQVYHLNRTLPAHPDRPWLLSDVESLRWNPAADYWLDAAEFERLSADPETVAEAAALYQGDLLEGYYDDWLFYERERLRDQYFALLSKLIARRRSRRDYAQAIGYAGQLLARDPLREDAARQLIVLRYEAGDRAGALQEYETFLRRLWAELDVDPMPETIALYEAILRHAGPIEQIRSGAEPVQPPPKSP